jgi:8-oxo-dGTP diphosphatase
MTGKYKKLGRVLFYITWPGIWLTLKLQPPRTRVVIVSQGCLLLVRDWLGDGNWSLPGGGLKFREDLKVGAAREVLEETGIKLSPTSLTSLGRFKVRSSGIKIDAHCFFAELPDKPDLKASHEIAEASWIDIDKLSKHKLSGSAKKAWEAFSAVRPVIK